jgi:hypothetical protein
MRKFLLSGVVVAAMAALCSCKGKPEAPTKTPPPTTEEKKTVVEDHVGVPPNYVPKDTALADIHNFAVHCRDDYNKFSLRAFTLHTVDLFEGLGLNIENCPIDTTDHLRGYLGMRPDGEFKFYFVKVVGAHLPDDAGHDTCIVYDGEEYVLDLNAPCPNTCDYTSPFYLAGQVK